MKRYLGQVFGTKVMKGSSGEEKAATQAKDKKGRHHAEDSLPWPSQRVREVDQQGVVSNSQPLSEGQLSRSHGHQQMLSFDSRLSSGISSLSADHPSSDLGQVPPKMSDDSAYKSHGAARSRDGGFWGPKKAQTRGSSNDFAAAREDAGLTSTPLIADAPSTHAESSAPDGPELLGRLLTERLTFGIAEDSDAFPGPDPGGTLRLSVGSNRVVEGEGGATSRRASGEGPRASLDSTRSDSHLSVSTFSRTHSRRSSFALERASLDNNRSSLEAIRRSSKDLPRPPPSLGGGAAYGPSAAAARMLCEACKVPEALRSCFLRLHVVPPDTPLPMTMLARLWGQPTQQDAEATANLLEALGILRVACLYDGTAWALVVPEHLAALGAAQPLQPSAHGALLDAYIEGRHSGVAAVPDDGYIMQNAGHHLVAAGRADGLKALLASPGWLERKLHSYGTAAVVSDFRRYLMVVDEEEAKLLLEAFQMSVSACLAHPDTPLLRAQMLGRLMAAPRARELQAQLSASEGCGEDTGRHASAVACLFTRTPSLEQAGGLQRMTLRGHGGGVAKVLLTAGGVDVVTVSGDGTARVWDMEIGDCVLCLDGHGGPVADMAITADSALLVTASVDATARVWELEKGECLGILAGHDGALNAVAMDAHGRIAVTGSADGTGRIWDLATCSCKHVLIGHGGSCLGAVCAVALSGDARVAVTASEDFTARVWDCGAGRCLRVLRGHSGWVVGLAFPPDGAHVLTASHDGTARVWSLARGTCERVLEGHAGRLNGVRLSPGPEPLAITFSDDFSSRIWNWATGECRQELKGHRGWIADAVLAPSQAAAITVSGDELAVVWDTRAGTCTNILDGHSGEVRSVVLTRKGRFAVTGSMDGTARVWDLAADCTPAHHMHSSRVHGLAVSPAGDTVISIGDNGALVWSGRSGACTGVLAGHAAATRWGALGGTAAPDCLLTASADRCIRAWHLPTANCVACFPGVQGSRVKSFAASADCAVAVVVLHDSTVTVSDTREMKVHRVLQERAMRDASRGHSGGVNGVVVAPDGALAATYSKDATARVWCLATGKCCHVLHGHDDSIDDAMLSGDGQRLITSSADGTARVWQLASGRCELIIPLGSPPEAVTLSADGALAVVVASDGHAAHVWDVAACAQLMCLQGHTEAVAQAAISRDAAFLATASQDATLRLWDLRRGMLEGLFMADTALTCCDFAAGSNGGTVIAGAESGAVHFLVIP